MCQHLRLVMVTCNVICHFVSVIYRLNDSLVQKLLLNTCLDLHLYQSHLNSVLLKCKISIHRCTDIGLTAKHMVTSWYCCEIRTWLLKYYGLLTLGDMLPIELHDF